MSCFVYGPVGFRLVPIGLLVGSGPVGFLLVPDFFLCGCGPVGFRLVPAGFWFVLVRLVSCCFQFVSEL